MAIIDKEYDSFKTNLFEAIPYPVQLYYLSQPLFSNTDNDLDNIIPLTHSSSILSIQSTPYLNYDDFDLYKIPYDIDRFRYLDNGSQLGFDDGANPKVFKIANFKTNKDLIKTKRLGNFKCYNMTKPVSPGRDWRNESRLMDYPYRFALLYDGICNPCEVKYHLCESDIAEVKVKVALNMNADYKLVIENYKSDFDGVLEGWSVNTSKELPCISNTYLNYLATNKNQMQQNVSSTFAQSMFRGGVSAIGNLSSGNLLGGVLQSSANLAGGFVDKELATKQQLAQQRDMVNVPNTMISKGSDFIMGVGETDHTLKLIRYRQPTHIMRRIGDYFALYGYKQNKIMKPNLKSRYYYNYIKTIGANIKGVGIPKAHLEELKQIFNTGTTIWHITNVGVNVGDYSMDNKEI